MIFRYASAALFIAATGPLGLAACDSDDDVLPTPPSNVAPDGAAGDAHASGDGEAPPTGDGGGDSSVFDATTSDAAPPDATTPVDAGGDSAALFDAASDAGPDAGAADAGTHD